MSDWTYDPECKQWDLEAVDGHVWMDDDGRFVAFVDGRRIGAWLNEENAKQAVEFHAR